MKSSSGPSPPQQVAQPKLPNSATGKPVTWRNRKTARFFDGSHSSLQTAKKVCVYKISFDLGAGNHPDQTKPQLRTV